MAPHIKKKYSKLILCILVFFLYCFPYQGIVTTAEFGDATKSHGLGGSGGRHLHSHQ